MSERKQLCDGRAGLNSNRILNDAAFEFFDPTNLLGLLGDRHVLVDDANTALLGKGNRKSAFRDGIHRGRNQGNVHLDVARQVGGQRHIFGGHIRVARLE